MIKKLLRASLLAIITISSSHALEIAGDEAFPPYSFKEGGKLTGIYTDIVNSALKQMGEQHKILAVPWKRGLNDLEKQKIDALFPPYYRPKERPYIAYSTDILAEKLVIFCHKDKAQNLNNFPADYKGYSIGQNSGFSSGAAINDAKASGIIRLSEVRSTTANLKKLINKRLDCYVNDRLSIKYELAKLQKAGLYDGKSIVETHTLSTEKAYLGINVKANAEIKAFLTRFNQQIESMKANGEIEKIVARYTN